MNERIKQLAEQCTISCIDGRGVELNEIDVEEFAELIVKEVFAKIEDERFEVYQPVKQSVMKHFGVEE